jgi:heme/copper-type cytochrome/quinol oxidase subunit 3
VSTPPPVPQPTATLAGVPARPPGRSLTWWGMGMFVLTELTLFANLIFSYLYVRARSTPEWPPGGVDAPSLGLPAVLTVVLLASSIPAQLASRAATAGAASGEGAAGAGAGRAATMLAVTAAIGVVFLGLQAVEYARTADEVTPRTNAYGSLHYTITGFHSAHVAVGVGLLVWAAVRAWRRSTPSRSVAAIVFYWHFVDAVWLVIVSVLYLSVAW